MGDIWDLILKIFQSNSHAVDSDTFCFCVTSVSLPQGTSRGRKYNTFDEECAQRRGIVTINNTDNLCLPKALVVAIAAVDKNPNYTKIRKNTGKLQTKLVKELLTASKVNIPTEGAGIPELQLFQDYLKSYQIIVYQYNPRHEVIPIYKGSQTEKRLHLLYHEGHYNVISSLTSAFCCGYFCEECEKRYDNKGNHRCSKSCPCCQQNPQCVKTPAEMSCIECKRSFRGQRCYEKHKIFKVCQKLKKCIKCRKLYGGAIKRTHVCGEIYCKICKKYELEGHQCFIQADRRKPNTENILFVFYDLETRQKKVKKDDREITELFPILCVFQQRCDGCIENDLERCEKCGLTQHILDNNPIERFIEYLLNMRKAFKDVVVIAHNGQAFDHQFLLNNFINKTSMIPELIMRGTKIIMMKVGNVKFIDSLNYFPMALSQLPKTFGLSPNYKKGYFPHLFNTVENADYSGPLPAKEYYSPDTMKSEDREIFLKWFEEHKNDTFIMKKDIVEYCISDVNILRDACLHFRKIMLEECNVCPFREAVTIAATCNLVYRRNFLKPKTVGIIPKNGYRKADNQSKIAIQWLIWQEKERQINISHAGKTRELYLYGEKVDGYCKKTNEVFEFYGCYYHGHPSCLWYKRDNPLINDPDNTLNSRYEATVAKAERLRSLGYEVIEKWECDFTREMRGNKEMKAFLENHPLLVNVKLNPRDAFYGGRTGNVYKYYKCGPGEKIKYIDVCSLYPWVCKNGKFPIGHPRLHVGNSECSQLDLSTIDGLIKCKILPPEGLYHPVLPIKQNDKLMFPLCRTCSLQKSLREFCSHNDEERALIGTWVIDEVKEALKREYILMEIYEIWDYTVVQYDKVSSSPGLFTDMMNKFIKMKQQSSGWPSYCQSEIEKCQYIENFLENEDIKLEYSQITKNPGLRSLAKLILNSFWGKFGQRENQPKTEIVKEPSALFTILTNPAIEVCNIFLVNEETVIVNWENKEEAVKPMPNVNVSIAIYTTAQARLKLYGYLEQLGNRVLYYDTDSVIYVSKPGEYEPPTGDFVGDMTNELENFGPGSYITEFVSGGPKNYAFRVFSTKDEEIKTVCKVKGICLNYKALTLLNFETIKDMVLNFDVNKDIKIVTTNIRRTKDHNVFSQPEEKIYRIKAEKRQFLEDNSSVPYGFKRLKQ